MLFLSTELPPGTRWSESTCRARFSTPHDSRLRLRRFRLRTHSMLRREVLSTQYYSQHHNDKFIPDIERQSRLIYVDYFEHTFFPIWSISTQSATCWDLELPLSLDLSQEQPPGIKSMSCSSLFTCYSFPLSFAFVFYIFVILRKYFESGTTSRYCTCLFSVFIFIPSPLFLFYIFVLCKNI